MAPPSDHPRCYIHCQLGVLSQIRGAGHTTSGEQAGGGGLKRGEGSGGGGVAGGGMEREAVLDVKSVCIEHRKEGTTVFLGCA